MTSLPPKKRLDFSSDNIVVLLMPGLSHSI